MDATIAKKKRPNRSARDRRAQHQRAQARACGVLLRYQQSLYHRGSQASSALNQIVGKFQQHVDESARNIQATAPASAQPMEFGDTEGRPLKTCPPGLEPPAPEPAPAWPPAFGDEGWMRHPVLKPAPAKLDPAAMPYITPAPTPVPSASSFEFNAQTPAFEPMLRLPPFVFSVVSPLPGTSPNYTINDIFMKLATLENDIKRIQEDIPKSLVSADREEKNVETNILNRIYSLDLRVSGQLDSIITSISNSGPMIQPAVYPEPYTGVPKQHPSFGHPQQPRRRR